MSENTNTQTAVVDFDTPLKRGENVIDRVTLRRPLGGALRGVKLVDLYNLDLVAVAKVLPRISEPVITEAEFLGMEAPDCAAIAGEVVAFLLTKKQRDEAGLA